MIQNEIQKTVDDVLCSRRSIRAYLPTPVNREDLERILEVAARAPSGSNAQPWNVYVATGKTLQAMGEEMTHAFLTPEINAEHKAEYQYYPLKWQSPYQERRRKVGWDLYTLLGLGREDKKGMTMQHARNFKFFDAPVGIIFTTNRIMEVGSWLDFGCFYQSVMIAARARGLDTCPQAAVNQFHKILRKHLDIPEDEIVLCGLSLGYEDTTKIENTLVTEREPVSGFAKFFD